MSCGIDIIEIRRIKKAVENHDRFLTKIFTESEILRFEQGGRRFETLAGIFAAKEAFAKAIGTGIGKISFRSIEVCRNAGQAPYIRLFGDRFNASVSISHCREYAAAVVTTDTDFAESSLRNIRDNTPCIVEHNNTTAREYAEKMRLLIPQRSDDANKGSCGRVVIIAGSTGMTGAAALSALGSLRSGAGLVTVMTPACEQPVLAIKLTEAMTVPLPHENGIISDTASKTVLKHISNADAVVFGPGLGKGSGILRVLENILCEFEKTLIIDADGINALSSNIDILYNKKCSTVLTPHPGEMSRLTGLSISEIQSDRFETAKRFAEKFGTTIALKGKDTVTADNCGNIQINPSGNCGMATGGTGDVLSGIIAGLAAQGCTPYNAAVLGVYLHGAAGDIAARTKGIHGLIASDLCKELPSAILETLNSF